MEELVVVCNVTVCVPWMVSEIEHVEVEGVSFICFIGLSSIILIFFKADGVKCCDVSQFNKFSKISVKKMKK